MAEEDFTWSPESIPPKTTIQYATLETESESFKRHIILLDDTPLKRYELNFGEILNTGVTLCRSSIRAHYDAQFHNYYAFYWTAVPSYLSAVSLHVRYDVYEEEPVDRSNGTIWRVRIVFREE